MRFFVFVALLVTATFQACDGELGRPNSPGNGQGYEGVKFPDGQTSQNPPVTVPATDGDLYGFPGVCADPSRHESVIRFSTVGYELIADKCTDVVPPLRIDGSQISSLQGPPVALIYNTRIYPKVSRD